MSAPVRHFLDIDELDAGTLRSILDQASALKSSGSTGRAGPGSPARRWR